MLNYLLSPTCLSVIWNVPVVVVLSVVSGPRDDETCVSCREIKMMIQNKSLSSIVVIFLGFVTMSHLFLFNLIHCLYKNNDCSFRHLCLWQIWFNVKQRRSTQNMSGSWQIWQIAGHIVVIKPVWYQREPFLVSYWMVCLTCSAHNQIVSWTESIDVHIYYSTNR